MVISKVSVELFQEALLKSGSTGFGKCKPSLLNLMHFKIINF